MIFTPEHCAMNVAGTKTMTRRVMKRGESVIWDQVGENMVAVFHASGRIKYQVGHTYANQPGRGKKGKGRILLKAIREERLKHISSEDITAEGYPLIQYAAETLESQQYRQRQRFQVGWDYIHRRKDRWANNPPVWVLTYEFVKASEVA